MQAEEVEAFGGVTLLVRVQVVTLELALPEVEAEGEGELAVLEAKVILQEDEQMEVAVEAFGEPVRGGTLALEDRLLLT